MSRYAVVFKSQSDPPRSEMPLLALGFNAS